MPASSFHQHFLLLHLLAPQVPSYAMPMVLELPSGYPAALVRAALQLIVKRHSILRTYYTVDGEDVTQIVLPVDGFAVPTEECKHTEWTKRAGAELATPFSLTKTPPIRTVFMHSLAKRPSLLLVNVHHVASDFLSNVIMHRELHQILSSLQQGIDPTLQALPVQYADYTLWQQNGRTNEMDAAALEWWRRKLDGAPHVLELPLDSKRSPTQAGSEGEIGALIDSGTASRLHDICREERINDLSGLLAAFSVLMLRLSGQDELVLGQPQSVRSHAVLEPLVGCLINTVPLRVSVPSGATFQDVMHRGYHELLQALEHANVPFYRIVQAVNPKRTGGHNPIFQAIVQLLPLQGPPTHDAIEDRTVPLLRDIRSGSAAIDLWMNLVERGDGALSVMLTYDTSIFRETTASQLMTQMAAVLEHAVVAPGVPVWTLRDGLSALPRTALSLSAFLAEIGLEEHLGHIEEEGYTDINQFYAFDQVELMDVLLNEVGMDKAHAQAFADHLTDVNLSTGTRSTLPSGT